MAREAAQPSAPWRAGAFLYSGRPDPTWIVPAEDVGGLIACWNELPPTETWSAPPSRLGYRGCWLEAPDGRRWIAHDRRVALFAPHRRAGGSQATRPRPTEVRLDEQRKFERAVLATAPAGTPVPSV
jgi:hypothetical protein